MMVAGLLVLHSSRVQTAVAQKLMDSVRESTGLELSFSSISLKPFNALVIKDALLLDPDPFSRGDFAPQDTVAYIQNAVASFSLRGLAAREGLYFSNVHIRGGLVVLVSEKRPYEPGPKTNFARIFQKDSTEDGRKIRMELRKGIVEDMEFRMYSVLKPPKPRIEPSVDWSDMSARADIRFSKLSLDNGVLRGRIDEAAIREKSGLHIKHLDADLKLKDRHLVLEGMHYSDRWTQMNASLLSMDFSKGKNFIRNVAMELILEPSSIALQSISYYASGAFEQNPISAQISSASICGPVADLNIRHMQFVDSYSSLSGTVSGKITGIPKNITFGLRLADVSARTEELLSFISVWAKKNVQAGALGKGEELRINTEVKGPLRDFTVKGGIQFAGGNIYPDICLKNLTTGKALVIEGGIRTQDVDISRITGTDALRQCSASARFSAHLPAGGASLRLDTLKVSRLNLLGYDYSDISAAGTFSQNAFNGRIISSDPNLHFMAQGLFNLSRKTKNAAYDFYASVGLADLHALNLDKRPASRISLPSLRANFTRTASRDLSGQIEASGLTLTGTDGRRNIGNISISSHSNDDVDRIKVSSSFINASYVGTREFSKFIKDLRNSSISRELPSLLAPDGNPAEKRGEGDEYTVSFAFQNTQDILGFALPGAYIADGTRGQLTLDREGKLRAEVSSGRIAYGDKFIRGLKIQMDNLEDRLKASFSSEENHLSDDIYSKSNDIGLFAADDSLSLRYFFENKDGSGSYGDVLLTGRLSRSRTGELRVSASAQPSSLCFKGQDFSLRSEDIILNGKDLEINAFSIFSNDQRLDIDGKVSPWKSDTLRVRFSNADMSMANAFVPLRISGRLSGEGEFISPSVTDSEFHFTAGSSGICLSEKNLGALSVKADLAGNVLSAGITGILEGKKNLDAHAEISMDDRQAEIGASFRDFDISFARGFTDGVFSDLGGELTGEIQAYGPLDDLKIHSRNLRLDRGLMRIEYTNVPYHLNGALDIDADGVHLDAMRIEDEHQGKGSISGDILFGGFKDITMNLKGVIENMEVFDTDASTGEAIYGNIFSTGRMSLSGPLNSLLLEAEATTGHSTSLHIPLANMSSSESSDLLRFRREEKRTRLDDYEIMRRRLNREKTASGDFGLKLKVKATPDAEVYLDLDEANDMGLSGSGQGDINIDLRKSVFRINGDYTLDRGDFRLAMLGIIQKNFGIKSGSSIKFNGDIMESELDIDALYSLKTSVATLLSDTTSVSTRRAVDCGIHIADKLKNPQLSFSIDIPDLDPTTQSMVNGALNTEAKIQKQFMALLLTSSFLPDDQSGIVNNSNMYYSTVTDIMSNQLNNILQKLEIPLDLGLSYQEGQGGTDIFDVAVSTQLFNNRVVVNGTIGNKGKNNSFARSDVVGDIDIEIKIDDNGQIRLTIFSHSADDYTNFIDQSQRNGVGIAYQKEYNDFRELLKELFMKKKERERKAAEKAVSTEETVKIKIENS